MVLKAHHLGMQILLPLYIPLSSDQSPLLLERLDMGASLKL